MVNIPNILKDVMNTAGFQGPRNLFSPCFFFLVFAAVSGGPGRRHSTGKDAEDGGSERLLKERKEDKDEDSREREHRSGAVKSSTDFLDQKETAEIGTASRSRRDDLDVGEVRSDEKMPKNERTAGREEATILFGVSKVFTSWLMPFYAGPLGCFESKIGKSVLILK